MQVLYIVIGAATSGVEKKLNDKVKFLRQENIGIQIVYAMPEAEASIKEAVQVIYGNRLSNWLAKKKIVWRCALFVEQWQLYKRLIAYMSSVEFDLAIMRYPVADVFLWRFMRKFRNRIVFEHNTIEERELAIRSAESHWFNYFYKNEKRFGKPVRRFAGGLIGVTREITMAQLSFAGKDIPNETITNGIDVHRTNVRQGAPFDGSSLNLLFLAGTLAPWHGVDKLVRAVGLYTGECKVHCYLVGAIDQETKSVVQSDSRFTVLPTQSGSALDRLFDNCHLGVGSLGFLDFLSEACPLKTREYWSRGLPFVISYQDSDLVDSLEMKDFCLQMNSQTPEKEMVAMMVDFCAQVYENPEVSQVMRHHAANKIDYKIKARQYARFLNSLNK